MIKHVNFASCFQLLLLADSIISLNRFGDLIKQLHFSRQMVKRTRHFGILRDLVLCVRISVQSLF